MNFKAVIANWIHEQCDTVFHSETLRCQTVGVCWMGVWHDNVTHKDDNELYNVRLC